MVACTFNTSTWETESKGVSVSFLGQLDVYSKSQASYIPGTADMALQVNVAAPAGAPIGLQHPHWYLPHC